MRYIEFADGSLVLAPRRANTHVDLVNLSGRRKHDVMSAGFLSPRYSSEERWAAYGQSVGLGIGADKDLVTPGELYVGMHRYGPVFATQAELLSGLENVKQAVWGMTEPSPWGDVRPVYSPMHPEHKLTADSVVCD